MKPIRPAMPEMYSLNSSASSESCISLQRNTPFSVRPSALMVKSCWTGPLHSPSLMVKNAFE